jgi:hypothetical protein
MGCCVSISKYVELKEEISTLYKQNELNLSELYRLRQSEIKLKIIINSLKDIENVGTFKHLLK